LGGSDQAKSKEHSAIDGHGVVEKSAGDLLEKRERFDAERRAFAGVDGILDLGAVGGLVLRGWCILGTPVPVMLELVEGCRDVSGH
jgi:hypothetical protein